MLFADVSYELGVTLEVVLLADSADSLDFILGFFRLLHLVDLQEVTPNS